MVANGLLKVILAEIRKPLSLVWCTVACTCCSFSSCLHENHEPFFKALTLFQGWACLFCSALRKSCRFNLGHTAAMPFLVRLLLQSLPKHARPQAVPLPGNSFFPTLHRKKLSPFARHPIAAHVFAPFCRAPVLLQPVPCLLLIGSQ